MRKFVFLSIFSLVLILVTLFLFGFTPRIILRSLPLYLQHYVPDTRLETLQIDRQKVARDGRLILEQARFGFRDGRHNYRLTAGEIIIPDIWQAFFPGRHVHLIVRDLDLAGGFWALRAPASRWYIDLSQDDRPSWRGLFRDAKVVFRGLAMTQSSGQCAYGDGMLQIHDLAGRLWGGPFSGAIDIDQIGPVHGSLNLTMTELDPDNIPGIPKWLGFLEGPLRAELQHAGSPERLESLALRLHLPPQGQLKGDFLRSWLRHIEKESLAKKIRPLVESKRPLSIDRADFLLRDTDNIDPVLSVDIISQAEQIFVRRDYFLERFPRG